MPSQEPAPRAGSTDRSTTVECLERAGRPTGHVADSPTEHACDRTPEHNADRTPGHAPDRTTGHAPDRTPEHNADRTAEDAADGLTDRPADGPAGGAVESAPRTERPRGTRGADTRALTQVLFGQLKQLQPGTPEHDRVRGALIEANLPLVRYAAARSRSRNEPMEDVVQVGTIGLINAIDRFDPDRGVQFPTFAMPTVVGEIKRYFRDNVRTVHVPRRLHELWVQVNAATEDLTTAFGRSPTTSEIAERLRISEEEVLTCIEAGRSYHATSLEAAQEGDGMPGLLDRLGYEDPALDGVEHRDLVRHLLVQLPEREQRILLLRYYNNLTQSQISAELGVSQMHVSRLLARSFQRLRSANRIEA
ncbi:RNA polymerase sigma factor SigF [Streptomyces fragilis]|uniref:RNA polymerase sigma factor SigF n=1 Tax=Streptomyces fragilis TaxID=67301 RepID=UPI0024DEAAB4|nr:RNA polymerase sigma factor SigF [Streptomyces fragilis]